MALSALAPSLTEIFVRRPGHHGVWYGFAIAATITPRQQITCNYAATAIARSCTKW